jgi:hypothetical protein
MIAKSCFRFVVPVVSIGVLAVLTASSAAAEAPPTVSRQEVSPEGLVTSCFQQPRGTPCVDSLGRVGTCFEGECIPHSNPETSCFEQGAGTPCIDRLGQSGACFEGECLPK